MSLDRFFKGSAMDVMASAGTIGLHMVSGPMVGFGIGYALDAWLETSPWCKLAFFLVGVVAGFMNVYEDTQRLLRKMQREDMARRGLSPDGERLAEPEGDTAHTTTGTRPAGAAGVPGTTGGPDTTGRPDAVHAPGAAQAPDAADAAVAAARRTLNTGVAGTGLTDATPADDDSLEAVLRAEMEDLQRELAATRKGSRRDTASLEDTVGIEDTVGLEDTAGIDPARLVDTTRSRLQ